MLYSGSLVCRYHSARAFLFVCSAMSTWIDRGACFATYATDRLLGVESRNASFSEGQQALLSVAFHSLGQHFGEMVAQQLLRLEKSFNSSLCDVQMQLDSFVSQTILDEEATEATCSLEATHRDIARRSKNTSRKQRRRRIRERYTIPTLNIETSRSQVTVISLHDALFSSAAASEEPDAREVGVTSPQHLNLEDKCHGENSYLQFDDLELSPSEVVHSTQYFLRFLIIRMWTEMLCPQLLVVIAIPGQEVLRNYALPHDRTSIVHLRLLAAEQVGRG